MTNIRYVDDIMLYAKSLNELEVMTEKLVNELRKIGLPLNAKNDKILRCDPSENDLNLNFIEISKNFLKYWETINRIDTLGNNYLHLLHPEYY